MKVCGDSGQVLNAEGEPMDAREKGAKAFPKGLRGEALDTFVFANMDVTAYDRGTWLSDVPYNSRGGMNRIGKAMFRGRLVRVHCGSPWFYGSTIEAWATIQGERVRGHVQFVESGAERFLQFR